MTNKCRGAIAASYRAANASARGWRGFTPLGDSVSASQRRGKINTIGHALLAAMADPKTQAKWPEAARALLPVPVKLWPVGTRVWNPGTHGWGTIIEHWKGRPHPTASLSNNRYPYVVQFDNGYCDVFGPNSLRLTKLLPEGEAQ